MEMDTNKSQKFNILLHLKAFERLRHDFEGVSHGGAADCSNCTFDRPGVLFENVST
jgi:hypothetical protein